MGDARTRVLLTHEYEVKVKQRHTNVFAVFIHSIYVVNWFVDGRKSTCFKVTFTVLS